MLCILAVSECPLPPATLQSNRKNYTMSVICKSNWQGTYHFLHMSGAFRRVPSPLQGTSHKIRSKNRPFLSSLNSVSKEELSVGMLSPRPLLSFKPGKSCASWLVTTIFGLHMRLVWWINRWHRCTSESLAITCTGVVLRATHNESNKMTSIQLCIFINKQRTWICPEIVR